MSKHVAVLNGGWSAEREVSLRSGKACAEALTRIGYRVTRIDVGRDIATVLGSAVAMQKDIAKELFRAAGVPVAEGLVATRFEAAKQHLMPRPYVIKPI